MSHRVVSMIRGRVIGKGKACSALLRKAVLTSMGDRADDDGRGIFASVPVLARLAACSERQLQKCQAELAADGLIELTGERSCRGGYVKEWRLNMAAIAQLAPVEVVKPLRTSAKPSGEANAPVRGDATVVKPLRTSAEVVQPVHESGEASSPRTLEPISGGGDARAKPAWQIVADTVAHPWLDPGKHQALVTRGTIVAQWVNAGADMDLDIIPTVRDLLARLPAANAPVRSWAYFTDAVRRATAARLAAEKPHEPIHPAAHAGRNGVSAAEWERRLMNWRYDRTWHRTWGPNPEAPGYLGPKDQSAARLQRSVGALAEANGHTINAGEFIDGELKERPQ